jgi:hypothetical protein
MLNRMSRAIVMAGLAVALAACGDDGSNADAGAGGRFLPLATGTTWTYKVTDNVTLATWTKTSTVEAEEAVTPERPAVTAFRVRTTKDSLTGDGDTVSWQEDTGTATVRHKEITYDAAGTAQNLDVYTPFKLRLDEAGAHLTGGAQWTETYEEASTDLLTSLTTTLEKTEQWTIEAAAQSVTVPAGTFDCVRVRRVNTAGGADKTYWFARGVGKVKESGDKTEELMSFTAP